MIGHDVYDSDVDSHDTSKRVVATSPNGKSEMVIFLTKSGYYKIKYLQGGELPPELRGKYTNYGVAEQSIKAYLNTVRVDAGGKTRRIKQSNSN